MVAAGHIRLDGGWKFAEFLRMVLAMQLADDAVGLQLQRGEQFGSSISSVVTGAAPAACIWLSAFDYNGAMSARTAGYLEAIEHLPEGAILVVPGVSWEEYEELLGDLGARPGVRVSYDEGRLEIMSPLPEHEKCKEFISDLARAFAEENNLTLEKFGSTTWKRRRLKKGTEPDTCFYVANAARIVGKRKIDLDADPPPDIAVEIDSTNESRAKFPIYAALGIPEIWRYDGKQVEMHNLKDGSYVRTNASDFLVGLSAELLTEFLEISKTQSQTAALRLFRERLRGGPSQS